MKSITFLVAILITINVGLLHAQTTQGKVLIGVSSNMSLIGTGSELMSFGYSNVKRKSDANGFREPEPDKTISFNLLPRVGYFVADNFAVGIDLNMALTTTTDGENDNKYSQRLLSVGPFVRYYIPTGSVLPFFELSGSFGGLNSKYDYSDNTFWEDDEFKSRIMSFGGGVGLAAPLGDRVMFDVLAGYNSLTIKDSEDNDDNVRTIFGTLGLKLGITILLGAN